MITQDTVYSDTVTIAAPAEMVWDILIDFANYSLWNSFCPELINKALAIGEDVEMMVDLGQGLQKQVETICLIEPVKTLAWEMILENKETLHACRSQRLTALTPTSCSYVSEDAFTGNLTELVIESQGQAIEKGFNACAYALKDYAEKRYASQS